MWDFDWETMNPTTILNRDYIEVEDSTIDTLSSSMTDSIDSVLSSADEESDGEESDGEESDGDEYETSD